MKQRRPAQEPALTHIKDLVPDPENRRAHNPRNLGMVVDALHAVGAARSIVIDEDNVILAGNGVTEAAAEAGITKLRVVEASGDELIAVRRRGLTPEQKRYLAIADNRSAELASWNAAQFKDDLGKGLGFEKFFTPEELQAILGTAEPEAGKTDPDAVPEERATGIVAGDLFELGRHRLLCGDSTSGADVGRLLGDVKPVVLTDPPYGIEIVSRNKVGGGGALKFGGKVGAFVDSSDYAPVKNDESTDTAREFYHTALAMELDRFIVWGGNYFSDFLPPSSCWLVWDKENTGNFADGELAWTSFDRALRIYRWMWNGLARKGDRGTEGSSRVHPTQKPVGLHVQILQDWTAAEDAVLDGFLGSGTTLLASEQAGRACFGIEAEPKYCQVIIDRWEAFTGSKAQKVGEAVRA
jgi:hypothetical protein